MEWWTLVACAAGVVAAVALGYRMGVVSVSARLDERVVTGVSVGGVTVPIHPMQMPFVADLDPLPELVRMGLNRELSHHGAWRCAKCQWFQPIDAELYWMPDSILYGGGTLEDVRVILKNSNGNSHGSGWCASCVRGLR